MTHITVSPTLAVSSQIVPQQVEAFANSGFKSIICNMPDGECGSSQPNFDQIATAASAVGMQAAYLPIASWKAGAAEAAAFRRLLDSLPKPIVAFCRSGNRSAVLWSMSQTRA